MSKTLQLHLLALEIRTVLHKVSRCCLQISSYDYDYDYYMLCLKIRSPVYLHARNALWEGIVLVQDESATNVIKKNRLVWKHCVQIQTLTSLCKNSTRNLYGIFYRPSFKFCIKCSPFFGQVALFSQTITYVMFCSLFSICPRCYDKNGKIMWRLS